MTSGPEPLCMAAAVLGWIWLASMNSMVTVAPVSFMKPSSICFWKKGSASLMKLDHWSTDRLTPLRLTGALAAGAVVAAGAAGLAASAGLGGDVGATGAAGLGASVGLGAGA